MRDKFQVLPEPAPPDVSYLVVKSNSWVLVLWIFKPKTYIGEPIYHSSIHKISQTIDSELDKDKKCRNYPFKTWESYKDCDFEFVHENFLSMGIMPFWATKDLNTVTNLR